MKKRRTLLLPGTLLVALLLLVGWGWLGDGFGGGDDQAPTLGAQVQRGPLRISVVERGNLKAADSVTLKNEMEGQTTVLYLIEEGTEVKEGDLLCELDASSLMDQKVEQEIQVQNAWAAYTKAQQDHKIQESQNLSDIERARRELEFARIDLTKYLEGDRRQEEQSADEEIMLAEQERRQAEQDLAWSQRLAERGFLEQSQLDADQLAMQRADVALAQAERRKDLLVTYEIPRRIKELEAEVEEKERELDRVKLQARARIAEYEANLESTKARDRLERDNLAKIESQIEKARIYAPTEGMVVYAIEQGHRFGSATPMQEGASVRERQEIITIPSSKGFIAEASLHESVLEKVRTGMPCLVSVDAIEGTFRGRVGFKAVLPDQNSWFANPDLRVYRTEVEILDHDPRMRPGMSCSVEILVDELEEATYIPVQSVFLDAGEPVALVPMGGAVEKRPVEVGLNNGKVVVVESGLEPGETVLLAAPPTVALAPAPERDREVVGADWGGPGASEGPRGGTSPGGFGGERPSGGWGAEGRPRQPGERPGERPGAPRGDRRGAEASGAHAGDADHGSHREHAASSSAESEAHARGS